MKNLLQKGFACCLFVLWMSWPGAIMAQEELDPLSGDRTENPEVSDPDNKLSSSKSSISIPRDSVITKPAVTRKSDAKNENPQDDILSFNFLYYIIQRFKLSDIVD